MKILNGQGKRKEDLTINYPLSTRIIVLILVLFSAALFSNLALSNIPLNSDSITGAFLGIQPINFTLPEETAVTNESINQSPEENITLNLTIPKAPIEEMIRDNISAEKIIPQKNLVQIILNSESELFNKNIVYDTPYGELTYQQNTESCGNNCKFSFLFIPLDDFSIPIDLTFDNNKYDSVTINVQESGKSETEVF